MGGMCGWDSDMVGGVGGMCGWECDMVGGGWVGWVLCVGGR